jgi:hypothetical protein
MSIALISNRRVLMTSQLDPHNDPNEAYEVVQTPAWLLDPPADWWTVLANGNPVRHYPPHRKDLAIQYAKTRRTALSWLRPSFGSAVLSSFCQAML